MPVDKAMTQNNHEQLLKHLDPEKETMVFAAGGTAGHINPALAIAEELHRQKPEIQIVFAGRGGSVENDLVARQGYPFYWIEAAPFGTSPKAAFRALRALWTGRREAQELLRALKVSAAVGTGGYVQAPVIAAAQSLGIKTFMHEQNAYPGKSVKSFSRKADCVFVSYENTLDAFPKARRVELSGNPIGKGFFEDRRAEARERLGLSEKRRYVVITGGSLGALTLNTAAADLAARLKMNPSAVPYLIHLICGRKHYKAMQEALKDFKGQIKLTEYAFDMPDQMAAADLVICRAGAGTCAELAAMGKPSILVPYPYAAADHQTKNAEAFVDKGAAVLIPDQDVSGQVLKNIIDELFLEPAKLRGMSDAAQALAKPDAASRIVDVILEETGACR